MNFNVFLSSSRYFFSWNRLRFASHKKLFYLNFYSNFNFFSGRKSFFFTDNNYRWGENDFQFFYTLNYTEMRQRKNLLPNTRWNRNWNWSNKHLLSKFCENFLLFESSFLIHEKSKKIWKIYFCIIFNVNSFGCFFSLSRVEIYFLFFIIQWKQLMLEINFVSGIRLNTEY